MDKFSIRIQIARASVGAEGNWIKRLNKDKENIINVRNSLRWKISDEARIRSRINKIVQSTEECEKGMRELQKALEESINIYECAENRILGNNVVLGQNAMPVETLDNAGGSKSSDWLKTVGKTLLDILGKAGDAGKSSALLAALLKVAIDGDGISAKDVGTLIKGMGNSAIGLIIAETSDLKKYFGLNDFKTISLNSAKAGWAGKIANAGTTFGDTLKDQLSPFSVNETGAKALNGAKVAGWAFSFIANGFSNYEEFNGFSGRMVAETVSETLIDIGKMAALTAAAAGGAALIGVSAPAVVVGGVAVAVSAVADAVCKSFTGKGVTEAVSDIVLDNAPKVASAAVNAVSTIGNAVSGWIGKIGNNLSGGLKVALA